MDVLVRDLRRGYIDIIVNVGVEHRDVLAVQANRPGYARFGGNLLRHHPSFNYGFAKTPSLYYRIASCQAYHNIFAKVP